MIQKLAADIIHEPLFEPAVAKFQGNDFTLTAGEKRKVSFFLTCNDETENDGDEDHADLSFLEMKRLTMLSLRLVSHRGKSVLTDPWVIFPQHRISLNAFSVGVELS